jgi:hypothetical protein
MAHRDPHSRRIRWATALAVAGVAGRALWNFLPVYPGSGGNGGFGPVINFEAPALIWAATAVALAGVIVLGAAAIRLLRRTPRSRAIAGGILFTLAALVLINTVSTLMYSVEYVHQVGDFYDVDASGAMWVGVVVGLVSVAAFAFAGFFALTADRTTSTDTPAMPSAALPAPPPD